MNKIKRILGLLVIIFTMTLIVSCGENVQLSLTSAKTTIVVGEEISLKTELKVKGEIVEESLDSIEFTSSNGEILSVSAQGVVKGLKEGNATINVAATYNNKNLKAKIDFTVKEALPKPANLKNTDGVLTWDSISNATNYLVKVNNSEHTVTETTFNINDLNLADGSYNVEVFANYNGELSLSSKITVIISAKQKETEAEMTAAVLKIINSNYLPEMDLEDFSSQEEYENYLNFTKLAKAYAKGAASSNMSVKKSTDLFSAFSSFNFEDITKAEDILDQIDLIIDLDLTSVQFASVLVEVVDFILFIQEDEYTNYTSYYQNSKNSEVTDKQALLNDDSYKAFMAKVEKLGSDDDLDIITTYFNNNIDYYDFYDLNHIIDIVSQELVLEKYSTLMFYRDNYPEDEVLQVFLNLVEIAHDNGDEDFINIYGSATYLLTRLIQTNYSINYYNNQIGYYENSSELMKDIRQAFSENKAATTSSISATINYLLNIYNLIDSDLISAINDLENNPNPTVIFVLKDQLVKLFKDSLPTDLEFEQMYLAFVILANGALTIEPSEMTGYAKTLGKSTNLNMRLLLELIDDIDLNVYSKVMTIVDGLVTYDEDFVEVYDYRKIVELVVYLGNLKNNFADSHEDLINQLLALETEDFINQNKLITNKLVNKLIEVGLISSEETEILLTLLAYEDDYSELLNIITKYGNEAFNNFVETNGKLALDLITLIENNQNGNSFVSQKELFKSIGAELFVYNDLLIAELTDTEIDLLADFVLDLVFHNIFAFSEEDLIEFGFADLIDDIRPLFKTLLKNAITLEIALMDVLEENNAFYEFANLADDYGLELALLIQLTLALDKTLTVNNVNLIKGTIELIYDNIKDNELLLQMFGFTTSDLAELKVMLTAQLDLFVIDINRVSKYDFYFITEEELSDFISIWSREAQQE